MIITNQKEALLQNLPIVFLDDVFTSEEVDRINLYFKNKEVYEAKVGGSNKVPNGLPDPNIRQSHVFFEGLNSETEWFFRRILEAATYINSKFFRYDLSGFEHVQYTEYNGKGANYDYHVDIGMGDNQPIQQFRKLSLSIVLSDPEEYTGGEFMYKLSTDDNIMEQKKGRLIAFPSWLLHKVAPVKLGSRKSLVVWICGPKFK